MIKEEFNTEDPIETLVMSPVFLPAFFVANGRQQFRKAFIKSYPSFIYLIRKAIPQITAGEELLCMLIHLNQSTDDIVAILGISRKSVNQARYRLRLKINLPTHFSLEKYIRRLTSELVENE